MSLAFADNPSGSGETELSDASDRRSFLLHKARSKTTRGPGTGVADASRLLEAVASEANLAAALLNVVRNKGAPGLDGQTVTMAEAKAPSIIAVLRHDLLTERYRPGDVRRVWLPKPGGGQRGLGIPNVVDRLVQQAVLQVLEPIFDPTFHPSSHGFRPKRGAHTAIAEAKGYLAAGYRTVIDLDLAAFFDRVHHQRLLARLADRVSDARIISLVRRMLTASVVMPDGTKETVREGTPQGRIIAAVGDPARFKSAAAFAAYVGVVPSLKQSGKRSAARAGIGPFGNASLRRALWMPVLVAVKRNPWLRAFYGRLRTAGKPPKLALIAAMRKLLCAIYSVAKNRKPFTAVTEQARAA